MPFSSKCPTPAFVARAYAALVTRSWAARNEDNDLVDWLPSIPAWAWVAIASGLLLIAVLAVRMRRPRESEVVALVRRRRELMSQLQQLAGDEAAELTRHESRRLRAGTSSIEVLEAAVVRAERMSASGELGPR
jgi:hypothetical protein